MAQGIVELLNTEIGGVDVSIPMSLFLQIRKPKYDSEMLDLLGEL